MVSYFPRTKLVLCFVFQIINAVEVDETIYKLDPNNRPQYIRENINQAFTPIRDMKRLYHDWGTYGQDCYKILLHEGDHPITSAFLQSRIDAGQTEINILDVGAGDSSWGETLATALNTILRRRNIDNVHINIINITGESYFDSIVEREKCTIYKFYKFKIEDLNTELESRGLHLKNGVDLAVSSWTFCHLVDPVGTLQILINLLRPNTGILISQWPDVNLRCESYCPNGQIPSDRSWFYFYKSISSTQLDILFSRSIEKIGKGYALKKKTADDIFLPFGYDPIPQNLERLKKTSQRIEPKPSYLIGSETVKALEGISYSSSCILGSKSLFEELVGYDRDFGVQASYRESVIY